MRSAHCAARLGISNKAENTHEGPPGLFFGLNFEIEMFSQAPRKLQILWGPGWYQKWQEVAFLVSPKMRTTQVAWKITWNPHLPSLVPALLDREAGSYTAEKTHAQNEHGIPFSIDDRSTDRAVLRWSVLLFLLLASRTSAISIIFLFTCAVVFLCTVQCTKLQHFPFPTRRW